MMADSSSISPITVASLARISTLALPLAITNTVTSNSASINSTSSIVALSNNGQLLSALSSLQSQLTIAVQSSASATSPTNTKALAQSFVATFNNLQGSIAALQRALGSDTSNLFTNAFANNASQLTSLSSIGIDLQTSSSTLNINSAVFDTELTSDANATRDVLGSATQALLDTSSGIESQLAGASLTLSNRVLLDNAIGTTSSSTVSDTSLPVDLSQALSADSVLNNSQLTHLKLATQISSPATSETPHQATGSAQAVATISVGNSSELPTSFTTSLPTATTAITKAAIANVAATTNGDVVAADLRTATARLALQNMLSDPSLQVLRKILDPYYPALVAATRISELGTVMPAIDPKAFAPDLLAQVSAVLRSRVIGYYKDTSVAS